MARPWILEMLALFIYYKSEYENKGEIERKNKGDFDDLMS